jgi:uncharacterized surface protein with fasciclin (FAS1) repeats
MNNMKEIYQNKQIMRRTFAVLLLLLVMIFGCKTDVWEDHTKLLEGVAVQNLYELISSDAQLSSFAAMLEQTGWDQELKSSKVFTVWAPTNEALANLGSEIQNNSELLQTFVSNHIVFDNILAKGNHDIFKIKMTSNKNLLVDNSNKTIDGVSLLGDLDIPATNGILHTIGAPLTPRKNVWELIEEQQNNYLHATYLNSLSEMIFDEEAAIQTGIDPLTGKPVYDTVSGLVWYNAFIANIHELNNEDSVYTYFLLSDNVFQNQNSSFKPYFNCGSDTEKTDSLTNMAICKDLSFRGLLELDDLNGMLVSDFGVKVPVTANDVAASYHASNGIVYLIDHCEIPVEDKILPIIIEAEDSTKFVGYSLGGRTGYTRQKLLASGGFDFVLYSHSSNPGYMRYTVNNVNSVKYKYYWKAVNDFSYDFNFTNGNDTIWQSLTETNILTITNEGYVFGDPIPISDGLVAVTDSTYETSSEVQVGSAIYPQFRDWMMIQVNGRGSNTPVTLDYIKMVPVFE